MILRAVLDSPLVPHVYAFDHKHRRPPMEMKDLLGGKGANLAEMMSVLRLPVPHGFTITTDACRAYMHGGWPKTLDAEVAKHVAALERKMGRKLGDANDPLLVSVRSGAKFSMPGMMDTILNLGLNDTTVEGLAKATGNPRFAYDSYRRFIQMFGSVVLEIEKDAFEHALSAQRVKSGVQSDPELSASDLLAVIAAYKGIIEHHTGHEFPSDPHEQLRGAVEAVFRSWNNDQIGRAHV